MIKYLQQIMNPLFHKHSTILHAAYDAIVTRNPLLLMAPEKNVVDDSVDLPPVDAFKPLYTYTVIKWTGLPTFDHFFVYDS